MTTSSATPSTTPTLPKDLRRLTSLRAFAALFVFTDHLALYSVLWHDVVPFRIGFTAVSFFFILSGFVLAWSSSGQKPGPFYRRRFARIYPSYVFFLIVAMVVPVAPGSAVSIKTVPTSLLLVQSWAVHNPNLATGINGVSWSLSAEAAFYLAFPFIVRFLINMQPRLRWALAVGWWVVCSAIVLYGAHKGARWYPLDYTNPVLRSSEFILGVVAALEVRRGWRMNRVLAVIISIIAIVACGLSRKTIPTPDVCLAPLYLMIVVAAAERDIHSPRGWLSWRGLVYAGEVSYAFYLVQEMTILNLRPHMPRGVGTAVVMLLVASAAAVVAHHAIELPCKNLLLRRRARGTAMAGG